VAGEDPDITTIREGYDSRAEFSFLATGKNTERIFLTVKQGEMWVVPKDKKPYVRVFVSECSVMVADLGDRLAVAHISYSSKRETDEVMKFLKIPAAPKIKSML